MSNDAKVFATNADDTSPVLPDGKGLNFADVQKLLSVKHEIAVPKDDPMLMFVTIINAFLAEAEKLHTRHEKGMGKLLADKTDNYVLGVQETADKLTDTLSSAASDGVSQVWAEHSAKLAAFSKNLFWCGAVISLSALVNVVVFILMGLR